MDDLLPCPFCGSEDLTLASEGIYYASCNRCNAFGPSGGWNFEGKRNGIDTRWSVDLAHKRWNTRGEGYE